MGLDTTLEETLVEKDLEVYVENELNFNFPYPAKYHEGQQNARINLMNLKIPRQSVNETPILGIG